MAIKSWRGRSALPLCVWAVAACAPVPAQPTAIPTATAQPTSAPPPGPPDPSPSLAAPRLQLTLALMSEHTGGEFGLKVPMLRLTLRNVGGRELMAPPVGLGMLLSLRLLLGSQTATEVRRVTVMRPWPIAVQPLAPGAELHQALSPLSRDQRDVPLALGRYHVSVCVIPHKEALYPSAFTEQFGGSCSNEIELTVSRGVKDKRRS